MYIVRVVKANEVRRYAYLDEKKAEKRKEYWERRVGVLRVEMFTVGIIRNPRVIRRAEGGGGWL